MSGMSALHSLDTAWTRAFRAKLDQVAAQGGARGRTHLGRAPSRLWLMDAAELERLPIDEFVAAYATPPGASLHRRVAASPQAASGGGGAATAFTGVPIPLPGNGWHESPCGGRSADAEAYAPEPVSWWRLPVRACAAAAAQLAVLIG